MRWPSDCFPAKGLLVLRLVHGHFLKAYRSVLMTSHLSRLLFELNHDSIRFWRERRLPEQRSTDTGSNSPRHLRFHSIPPLPYLVSQANELRVDH